MHVDPDADACPDPVARAAFARSLVGDTKYDPSASASSLKIGK